MPTRKRKAPCASAYANAVRTRAIETRVEGFRSCVSGDAEVLLTGDNAVASKHDLLSGWSEGTVDDVRAREAGDTNTGRAEGRIKAAQDLRTNAFAEGRRDAGGCTGGPHAVSECTPKRYDVGFGAKAALSGSGKQEMPPLLMLKPNEPRLRRELEHKFAQLTAQLKGPKVIFFIARAMSGDHQLVATLLSAACGHPTARARGISGRNVEREFVPAL